MSNPLNPTADTFLQRLDALAGFRRFPPLSPATVKILPPDALAAHDALPPLHRELFTQSNGLLAFFGYFRLFGFGYSPDGAPDAFIWNMPFMWKFTWPNANADFFSFGEDGWGNQFAYRVAAKKPDPAQGVFVLHTDTLEPRPLAPTFDAFLTDFLLREAAQPTDPRLTDAWRRFGPLAVDSQLCFVPSPLLGVAPTPDMLRVMNARQARIFAGDIFTHLAKASPGAVVQNIETTDDPMGILRLKLVFAPTST